jgi:UDP-glucuronate 4-epimerase
LQNVLVTGSTGFVGLPLADRLVDEGCAVVGYDPVPAPDGHEFETVRGDLQDVHQIYRLLDHYDIDTIIHSGAVSGSMLLRDDPYRIAQLNMFGTTHLIEAARASGVPKFVYISSSSAYGNTPPGPVDVDAPMRPGSVYSATKGAGDLLVMAYRNQFEMNIVSLRIGGLYGPGRRTWCVIKTMVENAVAGKPTHFDWGADQSRIHLYIDETVEAILRVAQAPEQSPQAIYNVTHPDLVALPRIAEIVKEQMPGTEVTFEPGGSELMYKREPFDVTATARDFNFSPEIYIEDGIARYLAWEKARVGA